MQTIENSLLQVSIDEKRAQLAHIISEQDGWDYLKSGETQEKTIIAFPKTDEDKNWAIKFPWTIVDKGDARASLTLIDTAESYKEFPYHFELMVTYALEGNQLNISFYLKNNSNKEMPFSLNYAFPLIAEITEKKINKIVLSDEKKQIIIESSDFKLHANNRGIICANEQLRFAGATDQEFKLTLTFE